LGNALPLNIHFVEDEEERWQFLNVRRTQPLSTTFLDRGSFHVVATAKDAEAWDGLRPILITTRVERGQESNIVEIARSLPREVRQVYVAFGVMSHPAIVLREQGITTIPAYLSHDLFEFPGG
jgi:hypothetical protein